MFVSVVIASKGRPEVLEATLDSIFRQSRLPDEVIVCVPTPADVTQQTRGDARVRLIVGPLGASVQRNVALDAVNSVADIVVFLDDDVELATDYLIKVTAFLSLSPEVIALSGTPASDTAKGGQLSRQEARNILQTLDGRALVPKARESLYGCNMAVRAKAARAVKFDERLKEYSYLEDVDFGTRLREYGELVDYAGERVVHFGTPGGRISEVKLGYVQLMNPLYLFFIKRTLSSKQFGRLFFKVMAGNFAGATGLLRLKRNNDKLDRARRKRILGNLMALRHVILKGIQPESVGRYKFKA